MAERKATNKYYPPDWDPSKGSINTYRGQHPLRDRARKISQGILTIRFEMPFNVWCDTCKAHIGKGVRYNADKQKVGNYYTTPIYSFTMKCHLCSGKMVIETDPKACDYRLVSGVRKKDETWDPTNDTQTIDLPDDEEKAKRQTDAMYRLEHHAQDVAKAKASNDLVTDILKMQAERIDQFGQNQLLRRIFREKKKVIKAQEKSDKALLAKSSLELQLVPESADDVKIAKGIKFGAASSIDVIANRKRKLQSSSIFAQKTPALSSTSPVASSAPRSAVSSATVATSDAAAAATTTPTAPAAKHAYTAAATMAARKGALASKSHALLANFRATSADKSSLVNSSSSSSSSRKKLGPVETSEAKASTISNNATPSASSSSSSGGGSSKFGLVDYGDSDHED